MTDTYYGQRRAADVNGPYNALNFAVDQALRQVRTAIPVQVVSVSGGGTSAPPTVSVKPLVHQIDGEGSPIEHGIVYGIPCVRTQGGTNGVVCDPEVGDVGYMVISDRDISAVKSTVAAANPGSRRRHSMADGVYIASMLNTPDLTQSVQFTSTGVKVFDKNGNTIVTDSDGVTITPATAVTIEGNLVVNGSLTANGDASVDGSITTTGDVTANDISLDTHTHSGVESGSGTTGEPVA